MTHKEYWKVTQEIPNPTFLNEILKYDAETGQLKWKVRPERMFKSARDCKAWNTRYANKQAFTGVGGTGYKAGSINGKMFYAHRVIWAMQNLEWPNGMIDHINSIKTDNRLINLRIASPAQNAQNAVCKASTASKYKGVNKSYNGDKWRADIRSKKLTKSLGVFDTEVDAARAYDAAAREAYGEFAKCNFP